MIFLRLEKDKVYTNQFIKRIDEKVLMRILKLIAVSVKPFEVFK